MPKGISLHIGLNSVDPSRYNGWAGTLAGCINDANAMQAICAARGFSPVQLLNQDATADAILTRIGMASHSLSSGDTMIISFSGHGGRVPDPTAESPDGLDDTWVAYDRMVLGHELNNLWSQFDADVRIEVYSDSCHSGTVIRELLIPMGGSRARDAAKLRYDPGAVAFSRAYSTLKQNSTALLDAAHVPTKLVGRSIPPSLALQLYYLQLDSYLARQWTRSRADIAASVILISGCQDNQQSRDGIANGLFTEKLISVWNHGAFQGSLPQFHKAILALMPPDQTPNYFTQGADDPDFTASRPFTVVPFQASTGSGNGTHPGTSGGTSPQPPSVAGPDTWRRDAAAPPSFSVTRGSNPYYIFEITSDPGLFANLAGRRTQNFYASWDDPDASARMADTSYRLPQAAWDALKGNSRLYYRVGSTSSATGWDNYMVSVTDGDAPSRAPSISISGSKGFRGASGIDEKWQELRDADIDLGAAASEEQATADNAGIFRTYQRGAIYSKDDVAWGVAEPIYSKYRALGETESVLGYPTSDQALSEDGMGLFNTFEQGGIYWRPDTGAWEVHGAIGATYVEHGAEMGSIGYPVSDEYEDPEGNRRNDFSFGYITWSADDGTRYMVNGVQELSPVTITGDPQRFKGKNPNMVNFYLTYSDYAIESENDAGVPALFALAQSGIESGWGSAKPGNMMFGIKASAGWSGGRQLLKTTEVLSTPHVSFPEVISVTKIENPADPNNGKYLYVVKDWFRSYDSPKESFTDHAAFLRARFSGAFNSHDPYAFARAVADGGYATIGATKYYNALSSAIGLLEAIQTAANAD